MVDLVDSEYQHEVEQLMLWCNENNLKLNTLKAIEMTVDFRRHLVALLLLTVSNSPVSMVDTFKFQRTSILQGLKWQTNIMKHFFYETQQLKSPCFCQAAIANKSLFLMTCLVK